MTNTQTFTIDKIDCRETVHCVLFHLVELQLALLANFHRSLIEAPEVEQTCRRLPTSPPHTKPVPCDQRQSTKNNRPEMTRDAKSLEPSTDLYAVYGFASQQCTLSSPHLFNSIAFGNDRSPGRRETAESRGSQLLLVRRSPWNKVLHIMSRQTSFNLAATSATLLGAFILRL